nr:hypothetical protein [Gammaproteobacteria bacterium]
MNKSTEHLKSLLNIPSPPTALEQQVETEVTTQAPLKETLRLLSERLSALPDNAYDDIRPIVYQLNDIVTEIRRPPETFVENQESIRICLQLAAACCSKLLKQSPMPAKSFACIESTRNMFMYYSKKCKPDRDIMKLHGRFLDRVNGVEDDLESLITDSVEGQALEEHVSTPRLTDKKFERTAEEVTPSSYEALNLDWEKLAGKRNTRSTAGQIKDLAHQIARQAHQMRQDRSEQDKIQLLTLGLAVEERHIQQMEQTNKPLDAISKALKRTGQYFYSLSQYHRFRGEGDIADKMQLQYLLTAERAENLSGILACRDVIHSNKTTASEKTHAAERERKFHSEKPDNTSELCEQYFERYLKAKEHLNKVQFKLLEIIQYDQLILSYNALDEDHEQEIPLEVQGRLFDLFETEAVQELQDAIESYYKVKCDYYDSVEQIHHTVESIRTLRFRAEFQRQAYALLFERYTNSEAPDDPALFIRNCHGILDEKAKSYSTPLLNAMVRQQLDIWSVEMPDPDDVSEHSEPEAEHAQEKPASRIRRFKPNAKKASNTVAVAPSVEEDETIWEQLSAAHQVCVIDFYSVID